MKYVGSLRSTVLYERKGSKGNFLRDKVVEGLVLFFFLKSDGMQVILGAPLCCKQAAVSECHSHDAFSDLAVVQLSCFDLWFHPRLRGLFGVPRAVCASTVQCVCNCL